LQYIYWAMHAAKRHIVFFLFLLLSGRVTAQDLTGTWEGALGTDQFLRLNIIQTGNKICGYTEDHIIANKRSFCKAFFEGYFDARKQRLVIRGQYFLANSGEHILMNLSLKLKKSKNTDILEQPPVRRIAYRERWGLFGLEVEPYVERDSTEYVYIKKVATQPSEFNALMEDCIARDKKASGPVAKPVTPKPADSLPPVVQAPVPVQPKDSVPPVVAAPVEVKKDSITKPKTITQRKNVEQSHLEVDVKTINLKLYDNAIMDGDTVSILYNGKMLLTHQLLSVKGIELNIDLDPNQTRHEITLFAENLGSIPPNTALVVITAGKKRYELFASASLEENAVLVFDYKPQ
jgi:hypothetical protein